MLHIFDQVYNSENVVTNRFDLILLFVVHNFFMNEINLSYSKTDVLNNFSCLNIEISSMRLNYHIKFLMLLQTFNAK